jgi:hypothetical protein
MKIHSTIMTVAALATLSVSTLAPTQASAWGMGGYHNFGGHSGGYRFGALGGYHSRGGWSGGYRRPWSETYVPRRSYYPSYQTSYPSYAPSAPIYAASQPAYAPAPVVTYRRPYAPQPAYVAAPMEAPRSPCPSEGTEPQAYTPAPQQQAYVQQQGYVPQQQVQMPQQGYAPQQQVQMPQAPQYQAPVQQPAQDRYSSTELQK